MAIRSSDGRLRKGLVVLERANAWDEGMVFFMVVVLIEALIWWMRCYVLFWLLGVVWR